MLIGVLVTLAAAGAILVWTNHGSQHMLAERAEDSAENRVKYSEGIQRAKADGFLKSCAAPYKKGGEAFATVTPEFLNLDFDAKETIIANVFSLYVSGDEVAGVTLLESKNNKRVGRYTRRDRLVMD